MPVPSCMAAAVPQATERRAISAEVAAIRGRPDQPGQGGISGPDGTARLHAWRLGQQHGFVQRQRQSVGPAREANQGDAARLKLTGGGDMLGVAGNRAAE